MADLPEELGKAIAWPKSVEFIKGDYVHISDTDSSRGGGEREKKR